MNSEQAHAVIIAAVKAIPKGVVASYGQIAVRAGLPKRARLVARVLSQLPSDSGVPWHRVVRANMSIAFAPGSADFERQRASLLNEGCTVTSNGRVVCKPQAQDLDTQLWGQFFS